MFNVQGCLEAEAALERFVASLHLVVNCIFVFLLFDLYSLQLVQQLLGLPRARPVADLTREAAFLLKRLDEVVQTAEAPAEHYVLPVDTRISTGMR